MKDEAKSETDHELATLVQLLETKDDLSRVLKSHIFIENRILEFIELYVPYTKYIESMELDYEQKVKLALAFGLHERFKPPLMALGKIRNKYAHRLDYRLTKGELNNFYKCLDREDKETVQQSFERFKTAFSSRENQSFAGLDDEERFALLVIFLRSSLRASIERVKELSGNET